MSCFVVFSWSQDILLNEDSVFSKLSTGGHLIFFPTFSDTVNGATMNNLGNRC